MGGEGSRNLVRCHFTVFRFSLLQIDRRDGTKKIEMKIVLIAAVAFVLICSSSAMTREKRTLNTFLRYFGFKVVPFEDVEFVTEKIIESTRNPKAIRIQTRSPQAKDLEEERNKTERRTAATTMRTTSTTPQSNFEKLPKELVDAAAQNLDALIEALTIMKAPNISSVFNQTNFVINVPSLTDMKPEKLIEGAEDIDDMEMMQPPAIEMNFNNSQTFGELPHPIFPPAVEMPQFPLPFPQTMLTLPLPSPPYMEFAPPVVSAFQVFKSKEISIPSNEIVLGNSILVSDPNQMQQNFLPTQQQPPNFIPLPPQQLNQENFVPQQNFLQQQQNFIPQQQQNFISQDNFNPQQQNFIQQQPNFNPQQQQQNFISQDNFNPQQQPNFISQEQQSQQNFIPQQQQNFIPEQQQNFIPQQQQNQENFASQQNFLQQQQNFITQQQQQNFIPQQQQQNFIPQQHPQPHPGFAPFQPIPMIFANTLF
jgi:hypothetical protein